MREIIKSLRVGDDVTFNQGTEPQLGARYVTVSRTSEMYKITLGVYREQAGQLTKSPNAWLSRLTWGGAHTHAHNWITG